MPDTHSFFVNVNYCWLTLDKRNGPWHTLIQQKYTSSVKNVSDLEICDKEQISDKKKKALFDL
jgi:hypothetical protein